MHIAFAVCLELRALKLAKHSSKIVEFLKQWLPMAITLSLVLNGNNSFVVTEGLNNLQLSHIHIGITLLRQEFGS